MSVGIDSAAAFINVLGAWDRIHISIWVLSEADCIPFFLGPGPCSSSKTQTVSSQKYITFLTRTPVWFFRAKAPEDAFPGFFLVPFSAAIINTMPRNNSREKDDFGLQFQGA